MNARMLTLLAIALMMVVGCIPSLHPIYTTDDLVFDESIVGTWNQQDGQGVWAFSKRDATSYKLVYADQDGQEGRLIAHLAEIDGTRFLDLSADPNVVPGNPFSKAHLAPLHTIYVVKQTSPTFVLASPTGDWLKDKLNDESDSIPHVEIGNRKVFSASTEQLQQFVLDNLDQFTEEATLTKSSE